MKKKFKKEEREFLQDVVLDYVPLIEIVDYIIKSFDRIPSQQEFTLAIEFILFLFEKYGKFYVIFHGGIYFHLSFLYEEFQWLHLIFH